MYIIWTMPGDEWVPTPGVEDRIDAVDQYLEAVGLYGTLRTRLCELIEIDVDVVAHHDEDAPVHFPPKSERTVMARIASISGNKMEENTDDDQ